MPHLLVAGATGRQTVVSMPLLPRSFTKAPFEVKFVLIDPKGLNCLYSKIEPFLCQTAGRDDAIITTPKGHQYLKFVMH
jgi:DNA segregation ATPase FtsK/SpoIIIE-like protein